MSSKPTKMDDHTRQRRTARGAGAVLILAYSVFALSATARASYQMLKEFSSGPYAISFSLLAALTYIAATIFLVRDDRAARRWARVVCLIELVGVLLVGSLSVMDAQLFPIASVWSRFGLGYACVPLILPLLALWWLHRRISCLDQGRTETYRPMP